MVKLSYSMWAWFQKTDPVDKDFETKILAWLDKAFNTECNPTHSIANGNSITVLH